MDVLSRFATRTVTSVNIAASPPSRLDQLGDALHADRPLDGGPGGARDLSHAIAWGDRSDIRRDAGHPCSCVRLEMRLSARCGSGTGDQGALMVSSASEPLAMLAFVLEPVRQGWFEDVSPGRWMGGGTVTPCRCARRIQQVDGSIGFTGA